MGFIYGILALSFLIIVHETGHFTVAKLSGIKVLEFSLFMGPQLFSFKKGETLYSIRAFPIGGYVKMEGEEEASDDDRAYNKKPVWIRSAVILAGPLMNIVLGIVLFYILVSMRGFTTTELQIVPEDSALKRANLEPGDRIVEFDNKKVYTDLDIGLFNIVNKKEEVNLKVVKKDTGKLEEMNVKLDALDAPQYLLGVSIDKDLPNIVSKDSGKFKEKDKIIKLNNNDVENIKQIRSFMAKNGTKTVTVTIERDGEKVVFEVKPRENIFYGVHTLGDAQYKVEKGNAIQDLKNSFISSYSAVRYIYYNVVFLVSGKVSFSEMAGPVGIVDVIGTQVEETETTNEKIITLLFFIALITINLGLVNLVPFPALDGSKIVILGVEAIRRKPISPEKEAAITAVGLVLLIGLLIFVTYNDILRAIRGY
mgnify:CR=1 FL=1